MERDGTILMVDDDRMVWRRRRGGRNRVVVRFRTLGDWPLSGAVDRATATTIDPGIIAEMARRDGLRTLRGGWSTTTSPASMERKKAEGYF